MGNGSHDVTGDHGANNGVGLGTIDISNTGSIQYAIQTATGIARDNLDNADTIMITDYQSGDRVEMRVDELQQVRGQVPGRVAGRDDLHRRLPGRDQYVQRGRLLACDPTGRRLGGGGDVSIVVAIVGENGGTATDLTGMDLSGVDGCTPRVT